MDAHRPHSGESADRPHARAGPARARFHTTELAQVCSHYDLGVIQSIHRFPKGSPDAPKVVLKTTTGRYLLKRRAPGRDNPYSVALSHSILLHLARAGFPVPRLVGTRTENNSMLQLGGKVYEVFTFLTGQRFDGSPASARLAGQTLARFHALLDRFAARWDPPQRSFHDNPATRARIARLARQFPKPASPLPTLYDHAAAAAGAGSSLDIGIVHGDWHPGNLLFDRGSVVAVLDLDHPAKAPRSEDIASGALQFSLLRGPGQPWAPALDLARCHTFLDGYRSVRPRGLAQDVRAAIPHLMIESLLDQASAQIDATGRLGPFEPGPALHAVARTAAWISANAAPLVDPGR